MTILVICYYCYYYDASSILVILYYYYDTSSIVGAGVDCGSMERRVGMNSQQCKH